MFRTAIAYHLPSGWPWDAAGTAELLSRRTFQPCSPSQIESNGFVPPRDQAELCHEVHGRYLVCFQVEEKLLPAAVIQEHVDIRVADIEIEQGYKPGRKETREIKDQVTRELLEQAFTRKRQTFAWICRQRGLLIVAANSANKADEMLSVMREALENMPVSLLKTQLTPAHAMTSWLAADEAPEHFTIDTDCKLVSSTESKAAVSYTRHSIDAEEIRRHIYQGKRAEHLGLTFRDRMSFILGSELELKRIVMLDVLTESQQPADDAIEHFDAQFLLEAAEIEQAFLALVAAHGGIEMPKRDDLVERAEGSANDGDPDPLYHQAVEVVIKAHRPSISLVQRHLKIGYNRAACLIEQMEQAGLVSPMDNNGNREVLAA